MGQVFGYKNIKGNPSGYLSKIKPDFHPAIERIGSDTGLFLGGNIPKKTEELLFENSELFIILEGNLYFKKHFYSKYPKSQEHQHRGNAVVIANLYVDYGLDILSDLTGDFILLIQENAEKKLIIVRDKIGGRKLYYTFLNGYIIFSSKIKSLLYLPGISRHIDYFALESFLKFGYVVAPTTIFRSIKELGPGHLIEISKDDYKIRQYWNLHNGDEIRGNRGQIREMLYKEIEENISVRLKPKERIGIYLSGGIDSNTLLALISKFRNPAEIDTMSIGYGEQYKDYHELNQARFSANYFGSNHHELTNGPEHIDKYLCKTVWDFEQPFGNPALLSWTALSELAKNLVDVVFVGAGADEVLGGYRRYNALNLLELYYRIPYYSLLNKILKGVLGTLPVGANHYDLFYRVRKFFDGVQSDILKTNEIFLFGDYDSLRKNIFLENFLKTECKKEPTLDKYYQIANTNDCFKQIFIADCYTDLVSEQLTRALIPLDEYGIDYRSPLSDPDFMVMCLNIPNKYKMSLFETKIIYKEAANSILPKKIVKQKKRGMSHPVNLWFQGPLYGALMSILSSDDIALRNYFNIDYLHAAAEEHYSKKRDWGSLLWKMIVFSMWHKLFMENKLSSMPEFNLADICLTGR
ncbi:MAG: asparagine synthetase B family protein [Candidatus Hodarchaeota archaeon]